MIATHMRGVVDHGESAWPALQAALHDELERLARFQPIGRLRRDVDAPREIVTRVLARLHANEFRVIKRLFESDAPPDVGAWIRVLVRTSAIDFMREHTEYIRGTARRDAGWVSLHSLASLDPAATPDSLVAKQREVERFLTGALDAARAAVATNGADAASALAIAWKVEPLHVRRLIKKGATYVPILRLVLAGHSYPAVAEQCGISRREVELVVGYIEEFLHARRFSA